MYGLGVDTLWPNVCVDQSLIAGRVALLDDLVTTLLTCVIAFVQTGCPDSPSEYQGDEFHKILKLVRCPQNKHLNSQSKVLGTLEGLKPKTYNPKLQATLHLDAGLPC